MRRIYDSEALRRDSDDPFVPNESDGGGRGHVDWANLSHAFLPTTLRSRAVSVSVETNRETYGPDDPVGFRVTFANRLPVPVTVVTDSPKRWDWSVDGRTEASALPVDRPRERTRFQFGRGERKRFHRRWHQRVRESERGWRRADPGDHMLAVGVNAVDGADRLRAETTFEIRRE